MAPTIVLACWRRDQGPKLNLVIRFYFISCGNSTVSFMIWVVVVAWCRRLVSSWHPKPWHFLQIGLLSVCSFFILKSVGLHTPTVLIARGTIWTAKLKFKTTYTKRSCYNSHLPVHCKENCPSFPVSSLTLIVLMWRIGWAHNNVSK